MANQARAVDAVAPLLTPAPTYASVTKKVSDTVLKRHTPGWWSFSFAIAFLGIQVFVVAVAHLVTAGTESGGIDLPVGCCWGMVNFVWWIGIGQAGMLISAILLLCRQDWRAPISRFAEIMAFLAISCAAALLILSAGRPWLTYWLTPYPNPMDLWPQFKSPLVWDVFAVFVSFTVSALFGYVGLLPDLATLRDRAQSRLPQTLYGVLALGWRGSARHWHRYETAHLLLAGLVTPLAISVVTIVSFSFAPSIVPGWHTTILPPYFVAGALFSGLAMLTTLIVPLRRIYQLDALITERHLDNVAKLMLATGLLVVCGHATEAFVACYSANPHEGYLMANRMTGPQAPCYWTMWLCNGLVPQLLWSKRVRATPWVVFAVALFVSLGMWLERYIIVVTSLHRTDLPSSWAMCSGTACDVAFFVGTFGVFLAAVLLFIRVLPMISMSNLRAFATRPARAPAPRRAGTGDYRD